MQNVINPAQIDQMVQDLKLEVSKGPQKEPRVWYDVYDLAAGTGEAAIAQSPNSDVFVNGEAFNVTMTKVVFAILGSTSASSGSFFPVPGLETYLQRIGFRFRHHDQLYPNPVTVPAPNWANKVVAQADVLSQGTVVWEFDHPVILSSRDTLKIPLQLQSIITTNTARRGVVSFHGYGLVSKTPVVFSGGYDMASTDSVLRPLDINTASYRNDSSEPVVLTKMVAFTTSSMASGVVTPGSVADCRYLAMNVTQVGDGSGARWFQGPTGQGGGVTPFPYCPMPLLGGTCGRGVVHEIADGGWTFNPGDGVQLDYQRRATISASSEISSVRVGVALLGYVTIA